MPDLMALSGNPAEPHLLKHTQPTAESASADAPAEAEDSDDGDWPPGPPGRDRRGVSTPAGWTEMVDPFARTSGKSPGS